MKENQEQPSRRFKVGAIVLSSHLISACCGTPIARAVCDVLEVSNSITCADPEFYLLPCGLLLFECGVGVLVVALIGILSSLDISQTEH